MRHPGDHADRTGRTPRRPHAGRPYALHPERVDRPRLLLGGLPRSRGRDTVRPALTGQARRVGPAAPRGGPEGVDKCRGPGNDQQLIEPDRRDIPACLVRPHAEGAPRLPVTTPPSRPDRAARRRATPTPRGPRRSRRPPGAMSRSKPRRPHVPADAGVEGDGRRRDRDRVDPGPRDGRPAVYFTSIENTNNLCFDGEAHPKGWGKRGRDAPRHRVRPPRDDHLAGQPGRGVPRGRRPPLAAGGRR
jgi:hypothetical protein